MGLLKIKYSIIIPSFNVSHTAHDVALSAINQNYDASCYEILWIDDCSTDATYEIIKATSEGVANFHLFRNQENRGRNWSRNFGVSMAKGSNIVFIDSDNVISPHLIQAYENEFLKANIIGLGNFGIRTEKYLNNFGRYWNSRSPEAMVRKKKTDGKNMPFVALCTANCAIRKDDFLAVGGIPEELAQADDDYLGYLLAKKGKRFLFVQEAISDHRDPTFTIKNYSIKFHKQGQAYRYIVDNLSTEFISISKFRFLLPVSRKKDSIKTITIKIALFLMFKSFLPKLCYVLLQKTEKLFFLPIPSGLYRFMLAFSFYLGFRQIDFEEKYL